MGWMRSLLKKSDPKTKYPIKVYILEKRKGKFEIDDKERGRRVIDEHGNEYLELMLRRIRLMPHHYGEIIRTRDGELAVVLYAHGPEEIYPVDFRFLVQQEYVDPHTGEKVGARAFFPVNMNFGEITKTGEVIDLEAIPRIDPKARQWFAQQLRENEILYPTKQGPGVIIQALPWVVLIIVACMQAWLLLKVLDVAPVLDSAAKAISAAAPVLKQVVEMVSAGGVASG